MKVSKKKKKKKRGRSALKKSQTTAFETETNYDDDKTSFMTTAELAQNQEFMGFIDDTVRLQQNPRKFKAHLPILQTLGIDNYDSVVSMDKLVFKMREALEKFKKLYQTLDKDKIKQIIRLCIARELQCVEERKDAAEYASKRVKSYDFFEDGNADLSAVKSQSWGQSSPSRIGSPSPKRAGASTPIKAGGRDPNNTSFNIRSIGESDGRARGLTFKDPPVLKSGLTLMPKGAPTIENLRRLSTKMGDGKSENGAKSARRSEVSGGNKSGRRSEPSNPYEEHTVEQMDVLIA